MQIVSLKHARDNKLTRYYTGVPCKNGHVGERLVSSRCCLECSRVKMAEARKLNPKKFRALEREYERNNKEKRNLKNKRYREKNPQYFQDYNKSTQCRLSKRQWSLNNPDKVREIEKARNQRPETKSRKRAHKHMRRALQAGSQVEKVVLHKVWERDGGLCYLCGTFVVNGTEHYDHVVPLSKQGTHTYNNIRVVHRNCNLRKGSDTPIEYFTRLKSLNEANAFQLELLNN